MQNSPFTFSRHHRRRHWRFSRKCTGTNRLASCNEYDKLQTAHIATTSHCHRVYLTLANVTTQQRKNRNKNCSPISCRHRHTYARVNMQHVTHSSFTTKWDSFKRFSFFFHSFFTFYARRHCHNSFFAFLYQINIDTKRAYIGVIFITCINSNQRVYKRKARDLTTWNYFRQQKKKNEFIA